MADLLHVYGDGSVSMATRAEGWDAAAAPEQVEVQRVSVDCFEAAVHLIGAYGTSEPVEIRVLIAGGAREHVAARV